MSKWFTDMVERTVATYLEVLLGLAMAEGFDFTNFGMVKSAALAAIPAGLAVIKAALARLIGDPDTASVAV